MLKLINVYFYYIKMQADILTVDIKRVVLCFTTIAADGRDNRLSSAYAIEAVSLKREVVSAIGRSVYNWPLLPFVAITKRG